MDLLAQTSRAIDPDGGIPWYAYLFYTWLLTSVGIYAYRVYRRIDRRDATGHGDDGDLSGGSSLADPARPAANARASALRRKQKHEITPFPDTDAPSPTQQLFQEELARKKVQQERADAGDRDGDGGEGGQGAGPTVAPADGRAGYFAASAATEPAPGATVKPVADLLMGVRMPCDLAPVMGTRGDFGPHRVALITSSFGPGKVGQSVGDELERLGYTLRSIDAATLEATKGSDRLVVTLFPEAKAASQDAVRMFPHAPPDSVAVVFSTQ